MPHSLRPLCVPLLALAALAGTVGCTTASPSAQVGARPADTVVEVRRRCALINIGTPERPRMVPDPACGSGSGR